MIGLGILGVVLIVFVVLPSLFGVDSRDGNDWVIHTRP